MNEPKCSAVICAAGKGRRMHTDIRKQFLNLGDKPLIYYSLKCFEDSPLINEIILVTNEDSVELCQKQVVEKYDFKKVKAVVPGGAKRYDSSYRGLMACSAPDYVFIHDGARPFLDGDMLQRALDAVEEVGASAIGVPAKDTIKIADDDGVVKSTPDRSSLWVVQTPQVFRYSLIRDAHLRLRAEGGMEHVTDDAMMIERLGLCRVKMVQGSYANVKITTLEDFPLAESILQQKQGIFPHPDGLKPEPEE